MEKVEDHFSDRSVCLRRREPPIVLVARGCSDIRSTCLVMKKKDATAKRKLLDDEGDKNPSKSPATNS
ncbi:hypothetical protein M8C21_022272 [Ambrosia artemisiifolia]|uniref:Uncharacterized protein n=1 Tax=Ambrosia artemisiifolia TaxID=4212 RepID=A0AAD5DAB4_AMBAR|nr:hypothetical protein M8C21_022272 [Ambrosia artemisiifolia]